VASASASAAWPLLSREHPPLTHASHSYDYRFTWIRDSVGALRHDVRSTATDRRLPVLQSFTLYALIRLGFVDEANAYMDFVHRVVDNDVRASRSCADKRRDQLTPLSSLNCRTRTARCRSCPSPGDQLSGVCLLTLSSFDQVHHPRRQGGPRGGARSPCRPQGLEAGPHRQCCRRPPSARHLRRASGRHLPCPESVYLCRGCAFDLPADLLSVGRAPLSRQSTRRPSLSTGGWQSGGRSTGSLPTTISPT
jgi:hypothetical protein